MKKTFSFILIGFLSLALASSCKKNWSCNCTYTISYSMMGFDTTITQYENNTLEKLSKKKAKSTCDDADEQFKQQMQNAVSTINFTMGSNVASGSSDCELKER